MLYDFGWLSIQLGLYIKTDFSLAVPALLGGPVLLDIFRMILAILLQVSGMLIESHLDARIIILGALGIVPTPAGIAVPLIGPLTFGVTAGLLAVAQLPVR